MPSFLSLSTLSSSSRTYLPWLSSKQCISLSSNLPSGSRQYIVYKFAIQREMPYTSTLISYRTRKGIALPINLCFDRPSMLLPISSQLQASLTMVWIWQPHSFKKLDLNCSSFSLKCVAVISINFFLFFMLQSPTSAFIEVLKEVRRFLKAVSSPLNCLCSSSLVTQSSFDLIFRSYCLFSGQAMFYFSLRESSFFYSKAQILKDILRVLPSNLYTRWSSFYHFQARPSSFQIRLISYLIILPLSEFSTETLRSAHTG